MSNQKGKRKLTFAEDNAALEPAIDTTDKKGKRKVAFVEEDVAWVQTLIEHCMLSRMNQQEAIDAIYKKKNIERSFTKIVWQGLEKQNQDFFKIYYAMLTMKERHKKQPEITNQARLPPNFSNGEVLGSSPTYDKVGVLGWPLGFLLRGNGDDTVGQWPSEAGLNIDHGASSSSLKKMCARPKEEMQMVKNLIEQCLVHYMNQKQVMDILFQKENIDPDFTKAVWQNLEEQNQEFFKAHRYRVATKDKVIKFSSLFRKQAAMMNPPYQPNEVTAMMNGIQKYNVPATATTLDIDRHRLGKLGLQLQLLPATTPDLHFQPPTTSLLTSSPANCRGSGYRPAMMNLSYQPNEVTAMMNGTQKSTLDFVRRQLRIMGDRLEVPPATNPDLHLQPLTSSWLTLDPVNSRGSGDRAELMNQSYKPNEITVMTDGIQKCNVPPTATTLAIDRRRLRIWGHELQLSPATTPDLHLQPPATSWLTLPPANYRSDNLS
ncbi:hypothetical protein QVD17_37568 [Tagetes erecta]|uniref:Uncharacterized protein n=1 Tax=Tagetes erecta TaxID=13708 RepID=A0AAD8JUG5_TARER|nr:hypothetical protein QVD17_37568 [Tagetes erecta]